VDKDVGIVFKVRAMPQALALPPASWTTMSAWFSAFQGNSDAKDSCFGISVIDDDVGIVFKVRAMP
jgi:hypothetical protein